MSESESYNFNIGRFLHDHQGWIVCAGFEGAGYRARRREGGPWMSALTLDELAEFTGGESRSAAAGQAPGRREGGQGC